MKTTLSKVKEWIERQLKSFEKHPPINDFDKGYKSAIMGVLNEIKKDGRY